MKSHEQQLHEWTTDEIVFNGGGENRIFNRDTITEIAEAFSSGDFAYLRVALGIRVDNMRYCRIAWDAFYERRRQHPRIDPQWLLRFSSVAELMFVLMNLLEGNLEASHAPV